MCSQEEAESTGAASLPKGSIRYPPTSGSLVRQLRRLRASVPQPLGPIEQALKPGEQRWQKLPGVGGGGVSLQLIKTDAKQVFLW